MRPAVTHAVATRRLRTDRMHHHIPGWTGATRAGLEAALRAAYDGPKHWLVPDRATVWMVDPKADPRRRTRGPERMREHTRSLLLNALRSDGTLGSTIQVQTCKAFRILPWEIGLRAQDSSVEAPKITTRADVERSWFEHVADPLIRHVQADLPDGLQLKLTEQPAGYVEQGLMTPEQVRAGLGLDEPYIPLPNFAAESDFERLWRISKTPADWYWLTAVGSPWLRPPATTGSFVDLHANPDLIGTTDKPRPRPGWFSRLGRRIARRNGDPAGE